MSNLKQTKRIRWTGLLLGLVALSVYVGFIAIMTSQ